MTEVENEAEGALAQAGIPVKRNKRGELVHYSFLGNIAELEQEHRRVRS